MQLKRMKLEKGDMICGFCKNFYESCQTTHTPVQSERHAHREFLLRNGVGNTCLWKNIFCSMNVYKSKGKRIFEIVHWPFELPPD